METAKGLTNFQLELLKMFSIPLQEDQLKEIKELLSRYFAEKATEEMDRLWEQNNWSDETMREWTNEHMRTSSVMRVVWIRTFARSYLKPPEGAAPALTPWQRLTKHSPLGGGEPGCGGFSPDPLQGGEHQFYSFEIASSNDKHFGILKKTEFPKVNIIGIEEFLDLIAN